MRGPQFMRGYWKSRRHGGCTARWDVLVGRHCQRDGAGFYRVVDRRKDMSSKRISVAPVGSEAGAAGNPRCGRLRSGGPSRRRGGRDSGGVHRSRVTIFGLAEDGRGIVRLRGERLTAYKQPREVAFCGGRFPRRLREKFCGGS